MGKSKLLHVYMLNYMNANDLGKGMNSTNFPLAMGK